MLGSCRLPLLAALSLGDDLCSPWVMICVLDFDLEDSSGIPSWERDTFEALCRLLACSLTLVLCSTLCIESCNFGLSRGIVLLTCCQGIVLLIGHQVTVCGFYHIQPVLNSDGGCEQC